jgi:hypothetical protein
MINIEDFTSFLKEIFGESIVYFDRFKPDLFFSEIDCLKDQNKKLSIEVASDAVKISSIDKVPALDFSLHDHSFHKELDAREYLLKVRETGVYIP